MAKGIRGSSQPCPVVEDGQICGRTDIGGNGYCHKHHQRWKKWGDPLKIGRSGKKITGLDLFWRKVNKNGPVPLHSPELGSCWLWTNKPDPDGYGTFSLGGKTRRAHQIAYESLVGPIPEGLVPDHLCRVRHCVNPAHLEWVTNAENVLRGVSPPAINKAKTHCIHGHPLTPENTYRYGRKRFCKTCIRERKAARKERLRNARSIAVARSAEPPG